MFASDTQSPLFPPIPEPPGTCDNMSDDAARVWTVFDGVRSFSSSSAAAPNPHTLMSEIDAAIASREHAHATSLLHRPSSSPTKKTASKGEQPRPLEHGAGLADEAYKAACAALAAGKPDAALRSLQLALVSCPPEKASAVSKIQSLIAYASQQQRFRDQHSKDHSNT